jgi:hypothetical protein
MDQPFPSRFFFGSSLVTGTILILLLLVVASFWFEAIVRLTQEYLSRDLKPVEYLIIAIILTLIFVAIMIWVVRLPITTLI